MSLTCNIDRRGRRIRLLMGIVLILIALPLLMLWAPRSGVYAWIISICILVAGLFGLFEWRFSWCAMRALGFRTRF